MLVNILRSASTNALRNLASGGLCKNTVGLHVKSSSFGNITAPKFCGCSRQFHFSVSSSRPNFWSRQYATLKSPLSSKRAFDFRFFSSNTLQADAVLPVLSPPSVGGWLMFSSALVFSVIVVGGVTRLTESGLSVTEWRPITGVLPPLSQEQWEIEFDKYKATPEFNILNRYMKLDEFKRIYYMEWAHRMLGRVVGLAFVLPLTYFALRKSLSKGLTTRCIVIAGLIGFEGFLGWYMVRSGLEPTDEDKNKPGYVPRVSQYRLAAHLGTALLLYSAMLGTGLAIFRDWTFAHRGQWSGMPSRIWDTVLKDLTVQRFASRSWILTGLVFLTALSGAFVAGLDAGLVYNEFPLMGGRLAPPKDELMNPAYATKPNKSDLWWRNILENPTTVQFDHRLLAMTTYVATGLLYVSTLTPTLRSALPAITRRLTGLAFGVANIQVLLGISTLLFLVPVPLAAAHQAGSVALLSSMIAVVVSLRPPGAAAKLWRQASLQMKNLKPKAAQS